MIDLTLRDLQPEIMDDPSLDPGEHEQALRGLARIHRLTNVSAQLWKAIQSQVILDDTRTLSILDLGCGDGHVLRQLYRLAERTGIKTILYGCDFSANAISFAKQSASRDDIPIEFYHLDVTQATELPHRADVVFCSLFLHHFSESDATKILDKMKAAAKQLVLVHDLRRTRLGYLLCWVGVHVLSRSHVVRKDGLMSVRAAFTVPEIKRLLASAGITQAEVTTGWPQRFTASWSKSEHAK